MFNEEELKRYSRQTILSEIGQEGQEKLKKTSILIVGMGGLGTPSSLYLSAMGIGKLGLVDSDSVDLTNIPRQILYETGDCNKKKVEVAKKKLKSYNPNVEIETFDTFLSKDNAKEIAKDYDLIIDASDNFPTRYLVNDVAFFLGKTLFYCSLYRFEGSLTIFEPAKKTGCYRCLFPEIPGPSEVPNCADAGILNTVAGTFGLLLSNEVARYVLGFKNNLIGEFLYFNLKNLDLRKIQLASDPECKLCGENSTILELREETFSCALEFEISNAEFFRNKEEKREEYFICDVREEDERKEERIEGDDLHIPLGELEKNLNLFPNDKKIVIYCHAGMRSLSACEVLKNNGFSAVFSLRGGISEVTKEQIVK